MTTLASTSLRDVSSDDQRERRSSTATIGGKERGITGKVIERSCLPRSFSYLREPIWQSIPLASDGKETTRRVQKTSVPLYEDTEKKKKYKKKEKKIIAKIEDRSHSNIISLSFEHSITKKNYFPLSFIAWLRLTASRVFGLINGVGRNWCAALMIVHSSRLRSIKKPLWVVRKINLLN